MKVRFMLLFVIDCYRRDKVQEVLQIGWRVRK